jgi:hypothetical protein
MLGVDNDHPSPDDLHRHSVDALEDELNIRWSAYMPIWHCMAVFKTMKLSRSVEKAIAAEQADRRLRHLHFQSIGPTVFDDRAVSPAAWKGSDPFGFALIDARNILRATS